MARLRAFQSREQREAARETARLAMRDRRANLRDQQLDNFRRLSSTRWPTVSWLLTKSDSIAESMNDSDSMHLCMSFQRKMHLNAASVPYLKVPSPLSRDNSFVITCLEPPGDADCLPRICLALPLLGLISARKGIVSIVIEGMELN
ncbi:hypothetical protein J6590_019684 [Homalodisca vitripennis]|nr:hypothetical protein J6590_019684 [Homalodisca vitripennis]